ncbi:MAG: glutamate 5-kinase [Desulfovibrio sp.]
MQDNLELRKKSLASAKTIVVKVGSAVLTGERGLDLRVVNRLADQLAALHDKGYNVALVSSGAVAAGKKRVTSFGNVDLSEFSSPDLPTKQAASAVGQGRLMHEYDEAFARYDKATAQILLTREDLKDRQRFLNARNTMSKLLDWRVIPIFNENDTVSVSELTFGDNDTLGALTVNLVDADVFINITSADGVFDKNPDSNPDAKCLRYIDNISDFDIEGTCSGKTSAGTGGMYTKLRAARRAAQLGVPTLIISGKTPFALERAFDGDESGTWVFPEAKSVSQRKFWLAYNNEPVGDIILDDGAATALTKRGKSLLPAGITEVNGCFGKGELVRLLTVDGKSIGVGLTNYSSDDLSAIKGHQSGEMAEIISAATYEEAVHRDNMLLDAL